MALAVAVPTFDGGGFSDASQAAFVALAGVALLVSAYCDGNATLAALRSPPAVTLGALAVLCIVSAAWTVGEPVACVRAGLTVAGYGAVFVSAAAFAQAAGPWPLAAGVAVLAAIEAVVGLGALALHALPYAEPIGGVWRPGGTFEYPPALAILEVGAIPILGCGLARGSRLVGGASIMAAVLAGAAIGLAGSRLAIGLAVVVSVILILHTRAVSAPVSGMSSGVSRGVSRGAAVATVALVLAGASVGYAVSRTQATTHVASHTALAMRVRRAPERSASAVARAQPDRPGSGSDVLHGRAREWEAALRTWLERPLLGAGAGAYYVASLPYQGSAAATLYAHDLPLELAAELGVLGLLLGVGLYAACAWIIARTRGSTALLLLGGTVVAFLVSNLLDWTWHLAGLGAVWAACAGGLAGCGLRVASESRIGLRSRW